MRVVKDIWEEEDAGGKVNFIVLFLTLFQYDKKIITFIIKVRFATIQTYGETTHTLVERYCTSSALFLVNCRDYLLLDQQGDVVIVLWAPCCLSIRGGSPRIWRRAHFHSCLCISDDRCPTRTALASNRQTIEPKMKR